MGAESLQSNVDQFVAKAENAYRALRWREVQRYALAALAADEANVAAKRLLDAAEYVLEYDDKHLRNRLWTAKDEQSGTIFTLSLEDKRTTAVAAFSAVYLLVMLGLLAWLAVDTWFDRNAALTRFGFDAPTGGNLVFDTSGHTSATYKLLISTVLAGAVGAVIDGIRSVIFWHSERGAYGWRFIWKDLARPWIGGALAIVVYFAVRSGAGVIDGDIKLDETGDTAVIPATAIAAVAGFSSRRVFQWLDYVASQRFSTKPKGD